MTTAKAPDATPAPPTPRFKDFTRPDDDPPGDKLEGFSLNGFDFPLEPELPQVGVTANWRMMTARYRGELQQAYQDYIEAAVGPDAVDDFRAAVRGGLRRKPATPEQIQAIVAHITTTYAGRPTEPSSSSSDD